MLGGSGGTITACVANALFSASLLWLQWSSRLLMHWDSTFLHKTRAARRTDGGGTTRALFSDTPIRFCREQMALHSCVTIIGVCKHEEGHTTGTTACVHITSPGGSILSRPFFELLWKRIGSPHFASTCGTERHGETRRNTCVLRENVICVVV